MFKHVINMTVKQNNQIWICFSHKYIVNILQNYNSRSINLRLFTNKIA